MKVFFRSLLIASLFFSFFSQAGAKAREGWMNKEKMERMEQRREEFHQKQLERLSRELELTKEQEEKISQAMKQGWEKISEEMKKMRERTLAIRKKIDRQIEKFLTPEQLEKFRKLKERWMGRGERRHFGPEPEPREPEHSE